MTRRSRRRLVITAALFVGLAIQFPAPAQAYLHLGFFASGESVRLHWATPSVRWHATDAGVPGVSATEFQRSLERAFAAWEAVPTASIAFSFAGFTSAPPGEDDDLSVLGFLDEPEMERVLGATSFIVDMFTGEIVESDVFFNSAFRWSVSEAGTAGRIDLQSVATHEIGHFIGLGHSALGETELRAEGGRRVLATGAVMFPISFGNGNIADRELQPDDIAAVSDLYPADGFRSDTGVARGRVLSGGRGLPGAHVVAFNPRTGHSISAFVLNDDGDFEIAGLEPGPHILRVEPLDDADLESFFNTDEIDVNFRVEFAPRLFIVPRGGAGERVDVTVQPK